MIDDAQLARPYAEAAHGHAQDGGGDAPAAWEDFLHALAAQVATPAMRAVLDDPRVQLAEARDVLDGVLDAMAAGGHARHMRAFAVQLLENGRLALTAEVARQYALARRRAEGILDAEIRTAHDLDSARVARIATRLKERFGVREVNTTVTHDASLTGGVVIYAGDDVIDGSVSAGLDQLRSALRRA